VSASIITLLSVVILPLSLPKNLFPFSTISISVISKLKPSIECIGEKFKKK